MSKFDFSDLLSLILALFAVGLAVAFYFKATDTSNKFYDNTYKFTGDVSQILGRIEAGFGERLRHLDEGYGHLAESVQNIPFMLPSEVKGKIEQSEEKAAEVSAEVSKILEEIASKAQLQGVEKEQFLTAIRQKEDELGKLRNEVSTLKTQLRELEEPVEDGPNKFKSKAQIIGVFTYMLELYPHNIMDAKMLNNIMDAKMLTGPALSNYFDNELQPYFNNKMLYILRLNHVLTADNKLTHYGTCVLQEFLHDYIH